MRSEITIDRNNASTLDRRRCGAPRAGFLVFGSNSFVLNASHSSGVNVSSRQSAPTMAINREIAGR